MEPGGIEPLILERQPRDPHLAVAPLTPRKQVYHTKKKIPNTMCWEFSFEEFDVTSWLTLNIRIEYSLEMSSLQQIMKQTSAGHFFSRFEVDNFQECRRDICQNADWIKLYFHHGKLIGCPLFALFLVDDDKGHDRC